MSDKQFENEIENLELQNLSYWSSYYAKEGILFFKNIKSNNKIYSAQRLDVFLKHFGISKTDLSQNCEKSVDCLVTIAQQLGLNKLNSSTYLMAINDLYNKKFEYEIEKIESIGEINNMNQNLLKFN